MFGALEILFDERGDIWLFEIPGKMHNINACKTCQDFLSLNKFESYGILLDFYSSNLGI